MARQHISRARLLASTAGLCLAGGVLGRSTAIAVAQTGAVVKIGSGNVEPNAQVFYAEEMGFFKKAGLNTELSILRSGSVTMTALAAGDLQCGVSNTVSIGAARSRSIPFVLIAPGVYYDTNSPAAMIVVAPNSAIKTAKDFNGLALGTTSLGGIDQLAWLAFLDANGADISTVKFLEVPPAAMAEAVSTGRVVGSVINDPELSAAIAAGKVKPFAKAYDAIGKLFLSTIWFTTEDWLAKNKDAAKRFREGIVNAGVWAMANPEQAVVVLEKYTHVHEDKTHSRFGRTLEVGQIQPVYDSAAKYKLFPLVRAAEFTWDGR